MDAIYGEIINKLREINVFEKQSLLIELSTSTQKGGTIDCYVKPIDYSEKNRKLEEYLYINNIQIEDYGVKDDSIGNYLESNINGSHISLDVNVVNDLRYYSTNISFKGSYDGEYFDTEIMDNWLFVVDVIVEVIKKDNTIFDEYRDSIGKLLNCVNNLKNNNILNAFDEAYIALEMLIKKITKIDFLTPTGTKEYLIRNGVNSSFAEKIRELRNKERIHAGEYGFVDQKPSLESEFKEALEIVIEEYFKILINYK